MSCRIDPISKMRPSRGIHLKGVRTNRFDEPGIYQVTFVTRFKVEELIASVQEIGKAGVAFREL
ncbi:MAG: hypothetical protein DRH37_10925, partial [Deltaproteobacteria bacterium]